ncbi:ceramidase-domain-containing protein [Pyronema domesticum]|nr:ceramidase-domain-containing protein [Pyronema domesticum]
MITDFEEILANQTTELRWSYNPSLPLIWGPPTSTTNFCEEDYYITPYIAEFINTVSNILPIYLGLYGTFKTPGSIATQLSYLSSAGVAFGSCFFHATLKHEMELVDGLSMLYSTAVAIFSVFSIHLSTVGSAVLAVGIFTLVTAVSIGQYAYPNPTLHGICFGGMVLMFLGRCIQLRRRVVKLRPEMDGPLVRLLGIGSVMWIVGAVMWWADWWACEYLIRWRRCVGLPVGFMAELHGWWHITTAFGAYYYLVAADYLMVGLMVEPDEKIELRWSMGVVPDVMVSQLKDTRWYKVAVCSRGGKTPGQGESEDALWHVTAASRD